MQYNIKGTGVAITDELREHVEKRLGTLEKHVRHTDAARVDVELTHDALRDGMRYGGELTYHEPGLPEAMRAEARGNMLHEAIDVAVGELQRELAKAKEKRIDISRRGGAKAKEALRGEE